MIEYIDRFTYGVSLSLVNSYFFCFLVYFKLDLLVSSSIVRTCRLSGGRIEQELVGDSNDICSDNEVAILLALSENPAFTLLLPQLIVLVAPIDSIEGLLVA